MVQEKLKTAYIKYPDIDDLDKIDEYNQGYKEKYPNFIPWFSKKHFALFLDECRNKRKGITTNGVYTYSFFLIDGERLIGSGCVRTNPECGDEDTKTYAAHISYGINPKYWKQGYGTVFCHLLIGKCIEFGIEEAMITCKQDNIGSRKIIENNFGTLKDSIIYEGRIQAWRGQIQNRFIINTSESFAKFEEKYGSKHNSKKTI